MTVGVAPVPAKPRPDPGLAQVYCCPHVIGTLVVVIDRKAWFLRTDHGEAAWMMRREWTRGLDGLQPTDADLAALGVR